MKLKRMLSIPFALAADVVTLGNMGDRTHTQQIFDAERREQQHKQIIEAAEVVAKIIAARSNSA